MNRPEIRKLIDQLLITDPELDSFLIDYFYSTFAKLSRSMERTEKVNILLNSNQPDEVAAALQEYQWQKKHAGSATLDVVAPVLSPSRRIPSNPQRASLISSEFVGSTATREDEVLSTADGWSNATPALLARNAEIQIGMQNSSVLYKIPVIYLGRQADYQWSFDSDRGPAALSITGQRVLRVGSNNSRILITEERRYSLDMPDRGSLDFTYLIRSGGHAYDQIKFQIIAGSIINRHKTVFDLNPQGLFYLNEPLLRSFSIIRIKERRLKDTLGICFTG